MPNNKKRIAIRIFVVLSAFSVCLYFLLKSISALVLHKHSVLDTLFVLLFLSGEFYFVLLSYGYMITILHSTKKQKNFQKVITYPEEEPLVAVIVAARHEPKSILENTFSTLKALDYKNKHIYLLDDSSDEEFKMEADEIAKKFTIQVYRRENRHGAKAGIINDFLKNAQEKYIVIFDADQNPVPAFIKELVPLMETNKKLAFIQTPQFYTNIDISPVAKGAAIQQAVFYESICEGKSSNNSMFCCGTNVMFRREALLDVGGFEEKSITEDFATSIKFHLKGYESLYHNRVSAFGMAPENLVAYFKQQIRWSAGTVAVFRTVIINFIKHPNKLTIPQWWEYFLSGIYYFIGWAFFIMMMGPILYLTLDIPSSYGIPELYMYPFFLYFIMTSYVFYFSMKERHYSFAEMYHGIIISFLTFPVLLKSTLFGLFGKRMSFVVTTKGKAEQLPIWALWPYIVMIILNLTAFVFGFTKIGKDHLGIGINMFWVVWHLFIISNIFYFNKRQKKG